MPQGADWAIIDGQEKKVCFLTLVNQVNGPLGGRSREPNGLIREEKVDDGNQHQREGHRLTHLQPYTRAPCRAKDTQILEEPACSHIEQAEYLLWLDMTAVKFVINVTMVQCEKLENLKNKWHDGKVFNYVFQRMLEL